MSRRRRLGGVFFCLVLMIRATATLALAADDPAGAGRPLVELGPGDTVKMEVFGQPDMSQTLLVDDDGTIRVPLAGSVKVGGFSPNEAAQKVEAALKKGYIIDPQVTLTVMQSRSQRVVVLGEVKSPGRYTIESSATVLDVIAEAGGVTDKGGDIVYVTRQDGTGTPQRYTVDLKGAIDSQDSAPSVLQTLRGGDRVVVPKAEQFYIAGEVRTPATYRLDSGMTLLEAIARAGGVTERGSASRVQIRRLGPDGKYAVISGKASDKVQPNDVITVKERIF
jgi:polysaccharide biosynthesis/export protein